MATSTLAASRSSSRTATPSVLDVIKKEHEPFMELWQICIVHNEKAGKGDIMKDNSPLRQLLGKARDILTEHEYKSLYKFVETYPEIITKLDHPQNSILIPHFVQIAVRMGILFDTIISTVYECSEQPELGAEFDRQLAEKEERNIFAEMVKEAERRRKESKGKGKQRDEPSMETEGGFF